jgi:Family of unknown function (DUF6188)
VRFSDDGPWELPVAGFEVMHLTFGASLVDINAYGDGGADTQIRLAGPFELRELDANRQQLDPESDSWERLAALFALRHDTITKARITKDSELLVQFTSGRAISSKATDGEAWEMTAPGGVLVVGTPGGAAIWDGEPGSRKRARIKNGRLRETLGSRIRRYALRRASPVIRRFRQKI